MEEGEKESWDIDDYLLLSPIGQQYKIDVYWDDENEWLRQYEKDIIDDIGILDPSIKLERVYSYLLYLREREREDHSIQDVDPYADLPEE